MTQNQASKTLFKAQSQNVVENDLGIVYTVAHKTSPFDRGYLLVDINSIYHFDRDVLPFLCKLSDLLIYSMMYT